MTTTKTASLGPSPLLVLSQIAQTTNQLTQQVQIAQIQHGLQKQLNAKIAALQGPVDQVSLKYSQSRINHLQAQQSTISDLQTKYGNNILILSDLTTQFGNLATAASNGDSAAFDDALSAANTDLSDLAVIDYNPIFQPDGVAALKTNGLTIQPSANYDLSTPEGQAAASADITAAQSLLSAVFNATSANQIVGTSETTALTGKISSLQSILSQQQAAQSSEIARQTATLTRNMQNQLHLIMLNLGKSSQISAAVTKMMTPPQQHTSLFGALQNAVGQSASGAQTQLNTNPAILSLFA